jgi:hypothetical protein
VILQSLSELGETLTPAYATSVRSHSTDDVQPTSRRLGFLKSRPKAKDSESDVSVPVPYNGTDESDNEPVQKGKTTFHLREVFRSRKKKLETLSDSDSESKKSKSKSWFGRSQPQRTVVEESSDGESVPPVRPRSISSNSSSVVIVGDTAYPRTRNRRYVSSTRSSDGSEHEPKKSRWSWVGKILPAKKKPMESDSSSLD